MVINVFIFLDSLLYNSKYQQFILNAIVINKNDSKIYKFCVLQTAFFPLKFVSSSYEFIISSHIIVELSLTLAKYFLFSQLRAEGFQVSFPNT